MGPKEHLEDYLVKEKFGAEAARKLCQIPGIFNPDKVYRREDINQELRDRFVRYGGSKDTTKDDVTAPIKKWLTQDDCPFEKIARGRYRFVSDDSQDDIPGLPGDEKNVPTAEDPSRPKPEMECGKGPCEVYAWCLPLYRQHPDSSGCWPIKIGRAGPDGFERRMRDFAENLPELPFYLLRIGCKDEQEAKRRESLLHAYFIERGKQIEVRGKEWFQTNPEEIEDAIDHVIPSASNVEAPAIEDTITGIFKGVPAGEWANLPENLTDKLDQYLYGAEE